MASHYRSVNKPNFQLNKFSKKPDVIVNMPLTSTPVNNFETKRNILNQLYNLVSVNLLRYYIITKQEHIEVLKQSPFYVSYNYVGISCLLIFTKDVDGYKAVLIDRRTLKYNREHLQVDNVKMYAVKVRAHKDVYLNTILDGILTPNHTFIVCDGFFLKGKNIFDDDDLYNKMLNISSFLNSRLIDLQKTEIQFDVNPLYTYDDLQELSDKNSDLTFTKFKVRGLVFYPKKTGTKYIFKFERDNFHPRHQDQDEPIVLKSNFKSYSKNDRKLHDTSKVKSPVQQQLILPQQFRSLPKKEEHQDLEELHISSESKCQKKKKIFSDEIITANFLVQKTDIPDNYILYLFSSKKKENKKFGNIYINSIKRSKHYEKIFTREDAHELLIKCQYMPDYQAWKLLKVRHKRKKPDTIHDVKEKLGL